MWAVLRLRALAPRVTALLAATHAEVPSAAAPSHRKRVCMMAALRRGLGARLDAPAGPSGARGNSIHSCSVCWGPTIGRTGSQVPKNQVDRGHRVSLFAVRMPVQSRWLSIADRVTFGGLERRSSVPIRTRQSLVSLSPYVRAAGPQVLLSGDARASPPPCMGTSNRWSPTR